jgi:RHS repeat-associated protein
LHETNGFAYDAAGNLVTLTDGNGHTTTWNYSSYGLTSNKVDATPMTILVYSYDANNRLTNRWSAARGNTTYTYDKAGNLITINYAVSHGISLAYDALNRLTNMIDATGTTMYGYDAVGQLLIEDGPWANDTVSYGYTARMRTSLSFQQPNAAPWAQTYGYDAARRLTNAVSPAGSFGYTYDPTDQMQVGNLTQPNGSYITNTYDSVSRLLSTALKNSGNSNLDTYSYSYNVGNQRTQEVFTTTNYINYTYDKIGQLATALGAEPGGATNRLLEQLEYGYDAAHNLAARTNNALVQNFTVNVLNELSNATRSGTLTVEGTTGAKATSVTVNGYSAKLYVDNTFVATNFTPVNGNNTYTAIGHDSLGRSSTNAITAYLPSSPSYTYDYNGNLLTDGTRHFTYDDENELTNVYVTNTWQSQFVYDGKLRLRIRREFTWQSGTWLETNEVHYIYDGNVVIQERNINNLPLVTYTRGKDLSGSLQAAGGIGGLLARTDMTINSPLSTCCYHADGNGNITALITSFQFIAAKYLYDPYGNLLSKAGPLADANVYRFSSKEYLPNSGLVYYLYRFYDPNLQRWPNSDPLYESGFYAVARVGGPLIRFRGTDPWVEVGSFTFCQNRPVSLYDALGLTSCFDDCATDYQNRMNSCGSMALTGAKYGAIVGGGVGTGIGVIFGGQKGRALSGGLIVGTACTASGAFMGYALPGIPCTANAIAQRSACNWACLAYWYTY